MKGDWMTNVRELRDLGYAVIIWTPEELKNVSPKIVEDRSIELGWEIINDLTEEAKDER